MHTCTHTRAHMHTHTRTYAHMHTHTCAHMHICTHTHTHTHTHTQVLSGSDEIQLQSQQPKRSIEFCRSLQKLYYQKVEKAFLVLVFVDAIVLALKQSGMSDEFVCALQIWQVCVGSSIVKGKEGRKKRHGGS